jgi:poly(3-hydroxybutyrate) depolymerase
MSADVTFKGCRMKGRLHAVPASGVNKPSVVLLPGSTHVGKKMATGGSVIR